MQIKIYYLQIVLIFSGLILASSGNSCIAQKRATVSINGNSMLPNKYLGNGVQWDPYQLDYGAVTLEIDEKDWQKLYDRLDFMRPQVIRVMINTSSSMTNGELDPQKNFSNLKTILDYCQSREVTVTFGDWGGGMVDSKKNLLNKKHLDFAAAYLDFLVNEKGYSCIQYYNLINEPNGFWSATDGNYELWRDATIYFQRRLDRLKLSSKVKIMAPDIAIWTTEETEWVSRSAVDLKGAIGLYDIHTYPSKITVNSGEYEKIINEYRKVAPADVPMIMGEIGFKFVEAEDSLYQKENLRRAASKPYASLEDSQMYVYDHEYGIDMADALFQTINAGYSGCVVWMLDDAMHSKESPEKLKVWGFWNILGEEYFGESEETVRPWFYAWSLLTKYMPSGSKVLKMNSTGDKNIKAVALKYRNGYTIALLNIANEDKEVQLQTENIQTSRKFQKFTYAKEKLKIRGDHELLSDGNVKINYNGRQSMILKAGSLTVLTTLK